MWKYSLALLFISLTNFWLTVTPALGQTEEEDLEPVEIKTLQLGLAFDYLKLHTLALDNSEKWEAAVNVTVLDKIAAVASAGIATLQPEDAYLNASYKSEGSYFRIGLDYQITIQRTNYFMLGLRYAAATFDENIEYSIENPVFDDEFTVLNRPGLSAQWYEFVMTSEKKVKRIFKNEIPDFLRIGLKFRVKRMQEFDDFEDVPVKRIPGYGLANSKYQPELNLFIKIQLGLIN
jgi:hypothetical protein